MQESAPLPTPSIRRRLASMFYESLLLVGVLFIGFLLPHVTLGIGLQILLPTGWLYVHILLLLGSYFLWNWHRNGRTLAMQTWKLRLVSITGEAPTPGQLMTRFMLAWPSILFFGAGLIWAVFDRDRQFLHDRIAGTRLVFVP